MTKTQRELCLEILQLKEGASTEEIEAAFERLTLLYQEESSLLDPLADDFSPEQRKHILGLLHGARAFLIHPMAPPDPPPPVPVLPDAEGNLPAAPSGEAFTQARLALGLSLNDLSEQVEISRKVLEAIEKELFSDLDDPGYLRWAVNQIARHLGFEPRETTDQYMQRYRTWQREQG